jgi:hypothetical protein
MLQYNTCASVIYVCDGEYERLQSAMSLPLLRYDLAFTSESQAVTRYLRHDTKV